MSSKDVIIADILSSISIPTEPFSMSQSYYFNGYIKSLHGIDIRLSLSFYFKRITETGFEKVEISLVICHSKMFRHCDGGEIGMFNKEIYESPNFNEETLSETLNKLLEILPTLKFNKYNGIFTEKMPIYTSIIDFFKDVEGLVLENQECCVCLEITNTTTECDHYLCVPCFQQIPLVGDTEDEDEKERPCPLCREEINYTD